MIICLFLSFQLLRLKHLYYEQQGQVLHVCMASDVYCTKKKHISDLLARKLIKKKVHSSQWCKLPSEGPTSEI